MRVLCFVSFTVSITLLKTSFAISTKVWQSSCFHEPHLLNFKNAENSYKKCSLGVASVWSCRLRDFEGTKWVGQWPVNAAPDSTVVKLQ